MPGLLERAQTILTAARRLRLTRGELPQSEVDDSGVSPEERLELLAQIERLFTERHHIETTERTKGSTGTLFPVIVNSVAIVVLLVSVLVIGRVAGINSQRAGSGAANYLTTEGLVVKAVKQQAQKELSQREARIAEIRQQLENLRSASRNGVAATDAARQKQLESELAALQSNTSARLSALTVQRQQRAFLIRQLQAIYQNVGSAVSEGKITSALDGISSADSLLVNNSSDANGEIAAVAPALSAGNAVLRSTLLFGQAALQAAQSSKLSAKITDIDGLVRQGDERYQAKDYAQAGVFYTKAIASLGSLARAYDRLQGMSKEAFDKKIGEMAAEIEKLKGNVATLEATIKQQGTTIAEQNKRISAQGALITEQQKTIAEQGSQLSAQSARIAEQKATISNQRLEVQRRSEELATVVNTVQHSIAQGSPTVTGASPPAGEVVDLLKTKVAIRWLADTPEARKAYPDLYRQLDPFFKKYAQTYSAQGRDSALNEIASALNDVILSLNLQLPANPAIPSSSPAGKADKTVVPAMTQLDSVSNYLGTVNSVLSGMLQHLN